MKSPSPRHLEARRLAVAGTPVFPCVPGGKQPATSRGFHDATTDLRQIDAWWAEADYNLAFCPHDVGLGVVDLDGPEAQAEWANLEIEYGIAPETYMVETPRPGGRHLYFRGELPASQHKLGRHIDTRGRGSYALVPPSVIDGRGEPDPTRHGSYLARTGEGVQGAGALPTWVSPYLEALKKPAAPATDHEPDLPANAIRAERYVRDCVALGKVAVEGQGGDKDTLVMAYTLRDLGVSPESAFKLLTDIWNPACVPPWDEDELQVKVSNAYRYPQNGAGAWAVGPSSDVFAPILGSLGLDTEDAPGRSPFALYTLEELAALPPPSYLIPDLIPAGGVTMFYGQPGSYKSFVVLMHAMELAAAGKRVIYVAGEGSRSLQLRADAWRMLHGKSDEALPIRVVGKMPWANDGEMLGAFLKEARPFKPDLVVLDTVARAMVGLNENDAKDMGFFVAFADVLKEQLHSAIAVIHHSGKDDARGPRGSQALVGAVDAAHEVKADKDTKAVEVWCRRMKDGIERERPWTYVGQPLGQSLVFTATNASEHRLLTHVEDVASPRRVGAALRELGAVGDENGVATRVLAAALVPPDETQSPEAREQAVGRLARALAARASGALEAYALGEGRERSWCLPGA